MVHLRATGREIARVLNEVGGDRSGVAVVVANPVGSSATTTGYVRTSVARRRRSVGRPHGGTNDPRRWQACLAAGNCRTEGIGQWVPVTDSLYAATVDVRAKTSPGTATFLIVSFLDEQWRHIGRARRPAARMRTQDTTLCVIARAPPNARFVGLACVCSANQRRFCQYTGRLRRIDP